MAQNTGGTNYTGTNHHHNNSNSDNNNRRRRRRRRRGGEDDGGDGGGDEGGRWPGEEQEGVTMGGGRERVGGQRWHFGSYYKLQVTELPPCPWQVKLSQARPWRMNLVASFEGTFYVAVHDTIEFYHLPNLQPTTNWDNVDPLEELLPYRVIKLPQDLIQKRPIPSRPSSLASLTINAIKVGLLGTEPSLVAVNDQGLVAIWFLRTLKPPLMFDNEISTWGVALHPARRLVAVSANNFLLTIFDLQTGTHRHLAGHTNNVPNVDFNAAGDRLTSCSIDGTVRVWDVDHGVCLARFDLEDGYVWSSTFLRSRHFLRVQDGSVSPEINYRHYTPRSTLAYDLSDEGSESSSHPGFTPHRFRRQELDDTPIPSPQSDIPTDTLIALNEALDSQDMMDRIHSPTDDFFTTAYDDYNPDPTSSDEYDPAMELHHDHDPLPYSDLRLNFNPLGPRSQLYNFSNHSTSNDHQSTDRGRDESHPSPKQRDPPTRNYSLLVSTATSVFLVKISECPTTTTSRFTIEQTIKPGVPDLRAGSTVDAFDRINMVTLLPRFALALMASQKGRVALTRLMDTDGIPSLKREAILPSRDLVLPVPLLGHFLVDEDLGDGSGPATLYLLYYDGSLVPIKIQNHPQVNPLATLSNEIHL